MLNKESRLEQLRNELEYAIEDGELDEDWLRQAVRNSVDQGIDAMHFLQMITNMSEEIGVDVQPMMLTISHIVEEEPVLYELTTQMMEDADQGLNLLIQQQIEKLAPLIKTKKITEAAALNILMDIFVDVGSLVEEKKVKKYLRQSIKKS